MAENRDVTGEEHPEDSEGEEEPTLDAREESDEEPLVEVEAETEADEPEPEPAPARPERPEDPREAAAATGESEDEEDDEEEILVIDDDEVSSPAAPVPEPEPEPEPEDDPSQALTAALADRDRSSAGSARPATVTHRPRRKKSGLEGVKSVAAPVLGTVGVLLLIPAVWAVMVLRGHEVWAADRDDADTMAMVMLVCWPIAIILLIAAVTFSWQVVKSSLAQKQAKKREKEMDPMG